MIALRLLLIVGAVALVAYGAHRALLWMERRGWIYYKTQGTGSMGAAALFSLNEVFHPEGHHTVIEQQEQDRRGARRQAPGNPPEPGEGPVDGPEQR